MSPGLWPRTERQRLLTIGNGYGDHWFSELPELLGQLARIGSRAPLSPETFDTRRVERIGARAFACEIGEATRELLRDSTS